MRYIAMLLVCLVGCQHVEKIESKPLTLFELETKIQQTQSKIEVLELQIESDNVNYKTFDNLQKQKSNLVYYTRQLELQKNFTKDKNE